METELGLLNQVGYCGFLHSITVSVFTASTLISKCSLQIFKSRKGSVSYMEHSYAESICPN